MTVDWWTLALQGINFLVLVWLLSRVLFRPVRAVIEKRRELSEKAFADAEALKAEAEAERRRFEEDRTKLAEERQAELDRLHAAMEEERGKVLAAAKTSADALVEDARKSLTREREGVLRELRGEMAKTAADLAGRLIRDSGAGAPGDGLAERIEAYLEALPADERRRLDKELEAADAKVTLVTATSLDDEQKRGWSERLGAAIGKDHDLSFETDPKILGGAELRFPHAVVNFSWAEQLRKAEDALQGND